MAGQLDNVRIKVTLDTQEARGRQAEMERGFERMSRTANAHSSDAFRRIVGTAGGVFAATFGQRATRDLSTLAGGGAVGDLSQDFSNWLGFGEAARKVSAGERARQQTSQAFGVAGAYAPEESLRDVFRAFNRIEQAKAAGEERIRVATEGDMSGMSQVGGALGKALEPLADAINALQRGIDAAFGASMATGGKRELGR